MAVLLPGLSWLLLVAIFLGRGVRWRQSFLYAALIWALLAAAAIETASLLQQFTRIFTLATWAIVCLGLLFVFFQKAGRFYSNRETRNGLKWNPTRALVGEGMPYWGVIGLLLLLTGITALIAPPNTTDSMTYHMSRVMHWIQNAGLQHYPSHITRQLTLNPGAEYVIAHLQILAEGDRLANLVQWFSYLGCLIAASLLAARLGANALGQTAAAVFAATLPMAILQASSTQNDLVVSLWLLCFVLWGLQWKETGTWKYALVAGAALGLAILTKATAYLYALPFVLWFAAGSLRRFGRRALLQGLVIALVVLGLNAGHYGRNWTSFGSPLATAGIRYSNEKFGPGVLISNVTRNLALHLNTGSDDINQGLEELIGKVHAWVGIDRNDPATTWPGMEFAVAKKGRHEDFAGNFYHLLLVVVLYGVFLFLYSPRMHRTVSIYLLSLGAGFLIFCLVLKWQPWHGRLHLPWFILCASLFGYLASMFSKKWLVHVVLILLIATSASYALKNQSRPLTGSRSIFRIPRQELYFVNRPAVADFYMKSANEIETSECRRVGLVLGEDSFEYPLWALLPGTANLPEFRHVRVRNATTEFRKSEFDPCLVLINRKSQRALEPAANGP